MPFGALLGAGRVLGRIGGRLIPKIGRAVRKVGRAASTPTGRKIIRVGGSLGGTGAAAAAGSRLGQRPATTRSIGELVQSYGGEITSIFQRIHGRNPSHEELEYFAAVAEKESWGTIEAEIRKLGEDGGFAGGGAGSSWGGGASFGGIPLIVGAEVAECYRAPRGYSLVTDPQSGEKVAMLTQAARALGLVHRRARGGISATDIQKARKVQRVITSLTVQRQPRVKIKKGR